MEIVLVVALKVHNSSQLQLRNLFLDVSQARKIFRDTYRIYAESYRLLYVMYM